MCRTHNKQFSSRLLNVTFNCLTTGHGMKMGVAQIWYCLFVIKPTRCTNFTNLFCHETTCFGQFVCLSSGVYSLYTQQCYMSYRFVDSFQARPSWSCSKAAYKPVWHIPWLSVQWINCGWWTDDLSETCRVSWQNKFAKLVHLVGFITNKLVTMNSDMNVKLLIIYLYSTQF